MDKPNILFFMTDQQRGDSIPPYSKAKTPNLDEFCSEGITFSNTYCPSPHCCPSRATFFSGLYPSQHGVWNNVNVANTLSRGLYEGTRLWSEDLKEAGYNLYYSGKWHVSAVESPADRGWDMKGLKANNSHKNSSITYEKPENDTWKRYKKLDEESYKKERKEAEILRPGYPLYTHYGVNDNPFEDQDKVDEAVRKIKNRDNEEKPWCQFVGTLGPHDPYFVPQEFLDMYDPEEIELPENFEDDLQNKPNLYLRTKKPFDQLTEKEHKEAIRHYLAFCSYEDYLFGQILEALEETGQSQDTLVIFTSDHGDYMGEHGLWCKGLPCFQGAYHVPAAVRWPSGIENPGRIVDKFVSLADFAPTILELTDIKVDREFTGQSLVPFLKNEKIEDWREAIYTQSNGNELYGIQRSVMTEKWKYVYNGYDFDELYNLENDPLELNNVIDKEENEDIVHKLSRKVWKFAYKTDDTCINPYIMVGLAPYGPGEAFK